MSAIAAEARIEGAVAPGFERVREVFAMNFARPEPNGDLGASLAVYRHGVRVVDLWGGWRDAARTRPWTHDTLVNVYSTTKGVVACAFAIAVERGAIDYSAPVTRYWPEFAAAGKGDVTVAHVLSHQAGLPGFEAPTSAEDVYDWSGCCAKLAAQHPLWAASEATCYHAGTFGFLAGEIFRRAMGETLGAFFAREFAHDLGCDLYLGTPASEDGRIAPMIAPAAPPDLAALNLPRAAQMAMANPDLSPEQANTRAWRAAELPAMNLHANADGVARLFAAFANRGELAGVHVISPAGIARMTQVQSTRTDQLLGFEAHWAHGVALNTTGVFGANREAFGHTGWGGSFGYADPVTGIAAAYTMNRMGPDLIGDARAVALANSIAACAA